ncbi:MAG: rhomboid family intramembrane serine protease [Cyanobacteriota bacterium]|nr:rhomboid family intramembrane serine protease [Cyanobacteriota bacterium]
MVPLKDKNPTTLVPYVTYGLLILNIMIFLYELTLSGADLERFFQTWAVVPRDLTASFRGLLPNQGRPEWLTLFTSQFLHGGFLHIAGNMLFLWVFGNNVEDRLGHFKFIIFYLTCGALAALTQWYFDPLSRIPSLGASGAIAGVLGAYILRFPRAEVLTLIPIGIFITTLQVPAWVFLGFWFVQQALYGLASLGARSNIGMEGGGIAYWAHAGGFVFGAVLGPMLGLFATPSRYDLGRGSLPNERD